MAETRARDERSRGLPAWQRVEAVQRQLGIRSDRARDNRDEVQAALAKADDIERPIR